MAGSKIAKSARMAGSDLMACKRAKWWLAMRSILRLELLVLTSKVLIRKNQRLFILKYLRFVIKNGHADHFLLKILTATSTAGPEVPGYVPFNGLIVKYYIYCHKICKI